MKQAVVIFFLLPYCSYSQQWQWVKTGGGILSDKGTDISIDNNSNIYHGGYYNTGQPAYTSPNFGGLSLPTDWGKEGLLARMSSNGTWQWANGMIGEWDERVLGVHVDTAKGYVYATGTTWYWGPSFSNISFGSCTNNALNNYGYGDEIFLGKFDLNGNCQWLIGGGSEGDDHGYDIVTDTAGNVYLTGFISDNHLVGTPAYFGSISVPLPYFDSLAFIAKISPSGNWVWVKTFGEALDGERDNKIGIDPAGNLYVVGGFKGLVEFSPSVSKVSKGGVDIFVAKFDSNGNLLWVETTGSTLDDRANNLAIDKFGNIYITGEFRDKVAFGSDTLNNNGGPGGRDIFVAKMRPDKTWVWAKKAGSNKGGDRGNGIVINHKWNIFVCGQFNGNAKFKDTTLSNNSDSLQIFVAAIDTNGKWRWAMQAGGTYSDRATGIACDDSCNVYITGFYESTAYFGAQSVTSLGKKDIYVAKVKAPCFDYNTTSPPPPPPPPPSPPNSMPQDTICEVFVPNVFSPNGDGENDYWKPYISPVCVKYIEVSIYDRWGGVVYQSIDPKFQWDGTFRGQRFNTGVFYYQLKIYLFNGEILYRKGTITIIN